MRTLLALRCLLILFVILYVTAMVASGLPPDAPAPALAYQAWVDGQPNQASPIWGMFCALGHVADLAGIVLLFMRKKFGVYLMIFGFLSCLGVGSGAPSIHTDLGGMLMAFVNIVWGAVVCLVFAASQDLFPQKSDA